MSTSSSSSVAVPHTLQLCAQLAAGVHLATGCLYLTSECMC
jgi:hypothetical protein